MKVAVTSLTRDRLDYSKACFRSLREFAGTPFDHFVFDNGSDDGTQQWLEDNHSLFHTVVLEPENIGINLALNHLLDLIGDDYDVVVNVDNDCELLVPDTLRVTAEVAVAHSCDVIGPHVQGLRHPPPIRREVDVFVPDDSPGDAFVLNGIRHRGRRVGETGMIGGIFMPLPRGWRYADQDGLHGNGDSQVSAHAHARGGITGYLLDFKVNHYRTTDQQWLDHPEYFRRREAEGRPR